MAVPKKTAARGYGAKHQEKRRRWAKRIYSGEEAMCARCGYPILRGNPGASDTSTATRAAMPRASALQQGDGYA
jgi:ribosomal protein L37E